MLTNKWVLVGLGVLASVVNYLATVDFSTMLPGTKSAALVQVILLAKVALAAFMPPKSQGTITATGGAIVTHT